MTRLLLVALIAAAVCMASAGVGAANDVNVTLEGHFGGETDAVAVYGDYAYIGQGQDFVVLDISNPASPVELGRVTTPDVIYGVAVSGDYAYVADDYSGLVIVDVSNKASPVLAGSYDTAGDALGVAVSDGYVYVADEDNGLVIVDVSNKASPVFAGSYDTAGWADGVTVSGDYAYVADNNNGLVIVDITDKSEPALAGSYDTAGYAECVAVSDDYAYVADQDNGLVIVDVSNKAAPALAGRYDIAGGDAGSYSCAWSVAVSDDYAYVADWDNGLVIVDVSNKAAPTLAGSYNTGGALGVAVSGDYVYVADQDNGLLILRTDASGADATPPILTITAPADDTTVSTPIITVAGAASDASGIVSVTVNGAVATGTTSWSAEVTLAVGENTITVVATDGTGLTTTETITAWYKSLRGGVVNVKFEGRYDTAGRADGVIVSGNYAYVAGGSNGLVIVDVTDKSAPTLAGSYDTGGWAEGVALSGDYAYVAEGYNGFVIVDVSNKAAPALAGSYDTGGWAEDIAVSDNYAYVADGSNGLVIVDISNKAAPALAGSYDTRGYAEGVAVSGDYAYVADCDNGLVIVDISNKAAPALAGSCNTGHAEGVALSGDYAYVADYYNGLVIVDITDKSVPALAGSYNTGYAEGVYAYGVALSGDYAYVANNNKGLVIVDVSNKAAPSLAGSYDTAGRAIDVAVSGDYAYVADRDNGLVILRLDVSGVDTTPPTLAITSHADGTTVTTPIITVAGTASDPSSIASVTVSGALASGAADWSTWSKDVTLTEGENTITVVATDGAGLTTKETITVWYEPLRDDNFNVKFEGRFGGTADACAVSGNYAYIGQGQDLVVLDVSNPASPVELGRVMTPGIVRDVALSGDYAYVADDDTGLVIVDVSDKSAPALAGSCDTAGHAYGVTVSGDYAYVVGGSNGLVIVDVSDKSAPSLVGSYNTAGRARGIALSGDYAYVADESNGLVIVNVSNKSAPALAGSYDTAGWADSVTVSGDYAYVADWDNGLVIVDVSDKSAPTLVGSYNTAGYAWGVAVSDDYAYVADWDTGLVIMDVTDKSAPTLVGSYNTAGNAKGVAVSGNYAYVATWNNGLVIVDITDKSEPALAGSYGTAGYARDVSVSDDYAYVAGASTGLVIVDISNKAAPVLTGSCDIWTDDVTVSGNYAYVVEEYTGIKIVDISNKAAPVLVGSYDTTGWVGDYVAVSGDYAYVVDWYGLRIIDISNKAAPVLVGSYETEEYAEDVVVSGNYAYVAEDWTGLRIIDISNKAAPVLAGSCHITEGWLTAEDVAVSGDYAYVTNRNDGLAIVDISNKTAPVPAGSYDIEGGAKDVVVSGNYAYVVGGSNGLVIVDVSDKSAPSLVGSYNTAGRARGVAVSGDYVYVADMDNGLVILRMDASDADTTPPLLTITSPAPDTTTTHSPTITIAGTASDPSGIASVTVNGVPTTGTTNWNADVNLVEGENIITIVAKDLEDNKRTVKLRLFYYAHEDVHPLFSNPNQVEVGGTFYRWYITTFRDSTITIDSNYLEYSQPDENGLFNVSVNTSKYGITTPSTIDVVTYSVSITKNGQTIHIGPSPFNFTLSVLPRNYSTSWYLGNTIGGGGGIILYAEGEANTDFTMTTGNQDSILFMKRDINDKGTIGATTSLFEAEAPGVRAKAVKGDIHGSIQELYGSQVNVDYENAEDVQKLEGALYILTSTIPSADPLTYKTVDAIVSRLIGDLTTDYYESGVGVSCGGGVDLIEVGFGPKSKGKEHAHATIGGADIGLGFEVGASLKNRTYPTIDSQEYLMQYVYSAEHGMHGSLLGNDIVDWGSSEYIDTTVIMGQDKNDVLYGKVKIKDDEKPVMFDYVTREVTYDYGPIVDENIINPFESDNIDTSLAFGKFIKNSENFDRGNITVVETRGKRLDVELPLGLTIMGVKISICPGIRMGGANNYPTDKNIIYNKESYVLEKYAYDANVQGSAEELAYITTSLLGPVGPVMEEVMKIVTGIAEEGKRIFFATGDIIFSTGTQFFTTEDPLFTTMTYSATSTPSTQGDQTPEIIISTCTPDEPTPQTMAVFGAMGVSSGYATSLSGGDFVIGNITDLQPYNISFTPAAQLTLNYTAEDVAGIDESNISIYRWDNANNSWMPFSSIVNTTENIVITNITRFGTYAIGYDKTNPVIGWNASNLYQGNITVGAIITDTGSGINTSAIRVYLDGNEQNFTYNIFSSIVRSTINVSVGEHIIQIYAEDTSGNSNTTEKVVASIEPVVVKYLQLNYIANDTIELSWTGENGTYSIRNYLIYRNAELVANTTQTNFTIRSTDGTTYMIYPVDANDNTGISKAITYRMSQLIPEFTYNWENTLYPTAGCPITFDATGSHLINGTIETNITTYTWIFNSDVNNTESGKIINHTFTDAGLHKITLQIENDNQNSATLTKIVNITASTKGDLNSDGILTPADAAIALQIAASGGWDPVADVNHDSRITSLDALMILQAAVGTIEL